MSDRLASIRELLVYDLLLPNLKGWVSGLAALVSTVLVARGINLDNDFNQSLEVVTLTLVTGFLTWLVPNRR